MDKTEWYLFGGTALILAGTLVTKDRLDKINDNLKIQAAVQTATLAELVGPNAPVIHVQDDQFGSRGTDVFYFRTNSEKCYLAEDGKAVLNTCYKP